MGMDNSAYLQDGILFLRLEFVGTEEVEATSCLFRWKTLIGALQKFEDVFDDYRLKIDLFLVIEVLRLEFNLEEWIRMDNGEGTLATYRAHVNGSV